MSGVLLFKGVEGSSIVAMDMVDNNATGQVLMHDESVDHCLFDNDSGQLCENLRSSIVKTENGKFCLLLLLIDQAQEKGKRVYFEDSGEKWPKVTVTEDLSKSSEFLIPTRLFQIAAEDHLIEVVSKVTMCDDVFLSGQIESDWLKLNNSLVSKKALCNTLVRVANNVSGQKAHMENILSKLT